MLNPCQSIRLYIVVILITYNQILYGIEYVKVLTRHAGVVISTFRLSNTENEKFDKQHFCFVYFSFSAKLCTVIHDNLKALNF